MGHKQSLSSCSIGVFIMVGILAQGVYAQADTGKQSLRTWLSGHGVVSRLVKLDRNDGFKYGLSLQSPGQPLLVIAPSRQSGWLVKVGGEEARLQPDAAGSLKLIAQDDDIAIWICYFKKLTTYLIDSSSCTTPLCYVDKFLSLLIGLQSCEPVEPNY